MRQFLSRLLAVGIVLATAKWSDPTSAQEVSEFLTLRDAVARVLDVNPELRGQAFALAGADARRDQAALRPQLELEVEMENIFGTDRLSVLDDAELTLQLATVLELGDKRALRVDAAERERELLLTDFNARRLDLVAEATRRFIRVVAAEREHALSRQSRTLAAAAHDAVKQRVAVGRGTALEQKNAELALTRADVESLDAENAIAQARQTLSALWGGGADAGRASAELFALPTLAPISALTELLDRSPNLTRFATELRVEDAKIRLAEAGTKPDITIGGGIRRLQGDHSNAFVLSASVPLGTATRSAPVAAEARSRRAQVESRELAARAELAATLVGMHLEADHRAKELDLLRDIAVPQAEAAVKLAQDGFSAGRYSLLELLSAQSQLIELQRQSIATAVAYHMALIEIERLTAAPAADPTPSTRN